jgi:hypothetical protein
MLDVGAAAASFVFFLSLVGLAFLSLIVCTYAAYSLFVALVNTAAGSDEVIWPGEPLQENLPLLIYFGWILAVWAVPVYLVLNYAGVGVWPRAIVIVGFLWLVFPVSLLSSLSGTSRWIVFRPVIVQLFVKQGWTALGFYLSTAVLLSICLEIFYLGATGPIPAIGAAGLVGAAGVLVYGRLLGRVAWLFSQTRLKKKLKKDGKVETEEEVQVFGSWGAMEDEEADEEEAKESDTEPELPPPPRKKKKKRLRDRIRTIDPWAAPPAEEPAAVLPTPVLNAAGEEDPLGPAGGSYNVAPEQALPKATDPELQPFGLAPESEASPAPLPAPANLELTKLERELLAPRPPIPPPQPLLLKGVYTFPFYSTSLSAFASLAFGLIGVNGFLHVLVAQWLQVFKD